MLIQSKTKIICSIDMAKVILAGASGMIGAEIKKHLKQNQIEFIQLTTSKEDPEKGIFKWDSNDLSNAEGKLKDEWLMDCEAVINLSGVSIAGKRWTDSRKKAILESRTHSTTTLVNWLNASSKNVRLVNASAIGFYGDRPNELVNEESSSGNGFMSEVCSAWENAANQFKGSTSIIRIGVVLSKGEGFLHSIVTPAKWTGLIGLGSGKQVISWVHIEDLAHLFNDLALGRIPAGTYNGVAPNPENLNRLIQSISDHTGIFKWPFNFPAPALKLVLGEMADVVLMGNTVSSEKVRSTSFHFEYKNIQQALHTIYHE